MLEFSALEVDYNPRGSTTRGSHFIILVPYLDDGKQGPNVTRPSSILIEYPSLQSIIIKTY